MIQYIYSNYGRERAGIAATVISYRGRSAIREVGKAFGLSRGHHRRARLHDLGLGGGGARRTSVARAGLDPHEPAHAADARARRGDPIGFPRHLSQHVGGFVITRSRLDEVVPIENAAMDDRTVIEWDKDDLDALGILKVDVLGARHADVPAQGASICCETHYGVAAADHSRCRHARTEDAGRLRHDASAPTRSAYSRSRAARRCRCCRG